MLNCCLFFEHHGSHSELQPLWLNFNDGGKKQFHVPHDKLVEGQRSLRNNATCWNTMSLSHKVRQTSLYSPLILSGRNLFPPSKYSNSFQLSCCCCHCYWLSIRHGVIKEWRRNCLGSAVALIALSEPSGRLFIKGGHEGERGGGWRCPPDKSVRAGSHCLVQPGSTRVPQFRAGTWQAPSQTGLSAPDRRPRCSPGWFSTAALVKVCLFIPDPLYPHHAILFSTMPNYSLPFSILFCIFPNFIY